MKYLPYFFGTHYIEEYERDIFFCTVNNPAENTAGLFTVIINCAMVMIWELEHMHANQVYAVMYETLAIKKAIVSKIWEQV